MSELLPAAAGMLLAAAAVLLLIPSADRPAHPQARSAGAQGRRRRGLLGARSTGPGSGPSQTPAPDTAGLLDLTGALLTSGVGIEAALDRLAACVPGAGPLGQVHRSLTTGADWDLAWSGLEEHPQLAAFGEHLAFAHATGAPTAELLESGARQARDRRRQEAEQRAARLGVQMVIPLGVCFLPAFILLGVVPVILSLLPGALGPAS